LIGPALGGRSHRPRASNPAPPLSLVPDLTPVVSQLLLGSPDPPQHGLMSAQVLQLGTRCVGVMPGHHTTRNPAMDAQTGVYGRIRNVVLGSPCADWILPSRYVITEVLFAGAV
jgi:hypothetical protein